MPEYLAPGVFVEETSFRPKTIEGVSTSTAGFVGPARFGPIQGEPELLTSFADFELYYGGLDQLQFDGAEMETNFSAQAVRAFFEEGGKRLYFARVYDGGDPTGVADTSPPLARTGFASYVLSTPGTTLFARYPGRAGNMRLTFIPMLSDDLIATDPLTGRTVIRRIQEHDTVVFYVPGNLPGERSTLRLYDVISVNDVLQLEGPSPVDDIAALRPADAYVFRLTFNVSIERPTFRPSRPQERYLPAEVLEGFTPHPQSATSLTDYFRQVHTTRRLDLSVPFALEQPGTVDTGRELAQLLLGEAVLGALLQSLDERYVEGYDPQRDESPPRARVRREDLQQVYRLEGGSDGRRPSAEAYRGTSTERVKSGFGALEAIDDISIVAAPGYSFGYGAADDAGQSRVETIQAHLINHAERMKYRIAVLDTPDDQAVSEVRAFRGKIDSKYAALYYPWVTILDPITGRDANVPPSGFVAGIYARNDVDHGVQKAPANEVVRLAVGFESMLNTAQQEVLNPEGVNCFRFFEGRGHRLWGARTATSDGEWKYVNLRRYFAYLEHSIDRGTQVFVFESNGEQLWDNVRRTVSDFLFSEWKAGRLMGLTTDEAYFVRCDRTTMTQNDIDNGRLICLIGVAPLRPAEFVIFRIGQKLLETRG